MSAAATNSQEACLIPGRPVVVLAGWLGCQQRFLRRYFSLYEQNGFHVVTRIASPMSVVSAAEKNLPVIIWPSNWKGQWDKLGENYMRDLAWDTLREVEASQCSIWIFHAFSNGGCFLWEQVRAILKMSLVGGTTGNENKTHLRFHTLHHKLAGVVFDSGPAFYDRNGTALAMKYCTWQEKAEFIALRLLNRRDEKHRASEFWLGMRNDSWDIPQLYIYSKDDELAAFEQLDELVTYRQNLLGRDTVFACKWESSRHCSHILEHPDAYRIAVETFVDRCLQANKSDGRDTCVRSRL